MVRKGLKFYLVSAVCLALATLSSAAFARIRSYENGRFADVSGADWFEESVRDVYELGLMEGESEISFYPMGTLTVAEGVTIAARIHASDNGNTIGQANDGEEWYRPYVDYASANGLMEENDFDDYDANIERYQIAKLFAAAYDDLPVLNQVETLPDVPANAPYADAVFKLYRAGILTGNDAYGTFAPYSNLLRSEMSAIAARIADSRSRVQKTFLQTPARAFTDAYSIIDAESISGMKGIVNGWDYDNRFDYYNLRGSASATLADGSNEKFYAFIRDFHAEHEGLLHLELVLTVASTDNGAYFTIENEGGGVCFACRVQGGVWKIVGETQKTTSLSVKPDMTQTYAFVADLDLDGHTATVTINNIYCGSVSLSQDASPARLTVGTEKQGKGTVTLNDVRLWKNHVLIDNFLVTAGNVGEQTVAGWDMTGSFSLQTIQNVFLHYDQYSLKADAAAGSRSTAKRAFTPLAGKVCFEAYVLFPEDCGGASVALTCDESRVLEIRTIDGKFYCGDTLLHDYIANVWQIIRIEADTNTGKAVVKVNGKVRGNVDFSAAFLDGVSVTFAPDSDAVMWLDNVKVFPMIEHADYPSYPKVAESTDYNVGIHMCYLWRDASHSEGFDALSPFPEFDTALGYYDEGNPEVSDWELKWLAEHGVDFIHVCWYAPYGVVNSPVKEARVSHAALQDGYMNAKYSDLVDFCIMWENNWQNVTSFEQFRDYLWPYWKEYFFSDERYVRLDNKALLTVWDLGLMRSTFGGEAGMAAAVDFMNEDLKTLGYDGIILLSSASQKRASSDYAYWGRHGIDGTYAYSFGRQGYDPAYQIEVNRFNTDAVKDLEGLHHVPTISVGFNDVARNGVRSPIITKAGFLEVCEDVKDILSGYHTGTWIDNTVMLSTWNEISEGTYIIPTASTGFDYLDAARTAFVGADAAHEGTDDVPTPAQLERINRMYPAHHSPIRRMVNEPEDGKEAKLFSLEEIAEMTVTRSYDMSTPEGTAPWLFSVGISDFSKENGVISGRGSSTDYNFMSGGMAKLAAADAPVFHMRMRTDNTGEFEVFFATSAETTMDQSKCMGGTITTTGEFVDYYVKMEDNSKWTGEVIQIRIDPMNAPGVFEISLIEFLNYPKADPDVIPGMIVNGVQLPFTFWPVPLDDHDYAVVGEADKGFYSTLGLFYQWDRFTGDGVLTLRDGKDNAYVFAVGSDTVSVNGEDRPLGYTLTLRDGLPVFHIRKLLELLGLPFTIANQQVIVNTASAVERDYRASLSDDDFEFDFESMTEGWSAQGAEVMVFDGKLCAHANHFDVAVIRQGLNLNGGDYSKLVVGFVYDSSVMANETPQFFYATKSLPGFSTDRRIDGTYLKDGKNDGDIVEAVFDLTKAGSFRSTVTDIRIDPFTSKTDFKVDYVRFVRTEDDAEAGDSSEDVPTETEPVYTVTEGLIEKKEYQWNFDNDGDIEDWSTGGCPYVVRNGLLTVTALNNDPGILLRKTFNADDVQVMVVGIVYQEGMRGETAEAYFITGADPLYTPVNMFSAEYSDLPADVKPGDVVELRFDLYKNVAWYDTAIGIRFDPFGMEARYSVAYIRLYGSED